MMRVVINCVSEEAFEPLKPDHEKTRKYGLFLFPAIEVILFIQMFCKTHTAITVFFRVLIIEMNSDLNTPADLVCMTKGNVLRGDKRAIWQNTAKNEAIQENNKLD